jgi:hypothetical protein
MVGRSSGGLFGSAWIDYWRWSDAGMKMGFVWILQMCVPNVYKTIPLFSFTWSCV